MYDSPINLNVTSMMDDFVDALNKSVDDCAYKAVKAMSIDVDREELIRALRADRKRYEDAYRRGYEDGLKIGEENGYNRALRDKEQSQW